METRTVLRKSLVVIEGGASSNRPREKSRAEGGRGDRYEGLHADAGTHGHPPPLLRPHRHFTRTIGSPVGGHPPLQMLTTLLHQQIMLEMGSPPSGTTLAERLRAQLRSWSPCAMPWKRASSRPAAGWSGDNATMTGSHLDLIVPGAAGREPMPRPTAPGSSEACPEAAPDRRRLRQDLRLAGGGTDKEAPDVRNMTQEELDAVVDEAHALTSTAPATASPAPRRRWPSGPAPTRSTTGVHRR